MKRLTAVILALCFLCIGTGTVEYAHNREHARHDAEFFAAAKATHTPVKHSPIHNDETCGMHAQLHMPALADACAPLFICAGQFTAFVIDIPFARMGDRAPTSIDCRGPPAV